jgi:[FeFe] hydrogenase (group B1/B3)
MGKKFDTSVQYLKYKVLREVARHAIEDRLLECYSDIPNTIVSGPKPTMRCCIYKERAIVAERIKLATGGTKSNPNIVEVIDIACDECPVVGYEVSNACRGCIAHYCQGTCKRDAITFDKNQKAHIDKDKCVECGRCAGVCPYNAISDNKRPCEKACKMKAISMSENKTAYIDNDKCITCGACVNQCPFGAIMDKSFLLDAIDILKKSKNNSEYKVYAVVAPSISSQFSYVKLGQVISGLKALGFHSVVEAALGADLVAFSEANELAEKSFLTSSCCPAFVQLIEKQFPAMAKQISHNLSPMAEIAKYIKKTDQAARVIFIGPCISKKMEAKKESVSPYVDCVLTFEELQALIDSRDIDLASLLEDVLDNASYYGRIFARSSGLADAVKQALKEQGLDEFDYRPISCDGIEACRKALLRASKNALPENFIEGMACVGGCIGGPACLTHGEKDRNQVDKYGMEAMEKTISDAIKIL